MKSHRRNTVQFALAALVIGLPVIAAAQGTNWVYTGSMNTEHGGDTATLLPNGLVLAAGGNTGPAYDYYPTNTAELYNPANATWTTTGSLNTNLTGHTATLLPNGQVLASAGYDVNGNPLSSAELYGPVNAPAPPFQITSIVQTNLNGILITWNTTGASNIV